MNRLLLTVLCCIVAPQSFFGSTADLPAAVDLPADKIKRSYLGAIQFVLTADGKFAYAIHSNAYGWDRDAKFIEDGSVIKVDVATLEIVSVSPSGNVQDRMGTVSLSKAGLVGMVGNNEQMRVLDPETLALARKVEYDRQFYSVWSSPASDTVLAMEGNVGNVGLINARWGEVEAVVEVRRAKRGPKFVGYDGYVEPAIAQDAVMSPDGKTLYTGSYDSIMKFGIHEKTITLDGVSPPAGGGRVALSPDRKRVLIAGIRPTEDVPNLPNRKKYVASMRAFGKRDAGDTYVYDVANLKKPVLTLKGAKVGSSIAVANDLYLQLSPADTILVYSNTGEVIGNFNLPAKLDPRQGGNIFFAFPDGRTLMTLGKEQWLVDFPAMNLTKKEAMP